MKKFWKVLGIAALAAAIPLKAEKDEETGRKTYRSLLLSVDVDTDKEGKTADIGINLGEGLLSGPLSRAVAAKKETVHFADDDPEAAVVDTPLTELAADAVETAVEETADDVKEAVEDITEAVEEAFDPEA